MSDIHEEESAAGPLSSGSELENDYESNDSDSFNVDDEEDDDEGSSFPLGCLSDGLVGSRLILHIDQTGTQVSEVVNNENQSSSTATSLSDTASEHISTRAVMGDTSSAAETIGLQPEEDAADNTSVADSETERRVRNIQNTIFSSLENDLAELVRMREETIQFLESGIRSSVAADETEPRPDRTGEDPLNSNSVPAFLRDRLTYYSRPFTVGPVSQTESGGGESSGETSSKRPSYTPVAKFENAPAATPGKPYLEVGLTTCDEKAAAARRVLDKLQYGDQEDETACFVRRFWRETSTMMETPRPAQSPTAEQTASLEATIAEAFDGLRLRLQQSQLEGEGNPGTSSETGELETPSRLLSNQDNEMFRMWNEETSILNNPLNYDIWNELEEGSNTGPVIAARINMAERRSLATAELRQLANRNPSGTSRRPNTTCVGVGTNEGAELDDESSDDEEMINYLRLRCNEAINQRSDRLSVMPPSLTEESQSFFRDIGVSAEMGQDIFNMFSLQDEDLRLPDSLHQGGDENRGGMNLDEIPQPLFPRDGQISAESQEAYDTTAENVNEDDTGSSPVPQLPMFDVTPSINFCPNREDNCSTRVYLDQEYMDFPYVHQDESHNEDVSES